MKIQELFDTGKRLDRKIESVVTFADNTSEDLSSEIKEYVVTDKLHSSYHNVLDLMQNGFSDGANEVGVWVSGFYGSGKSSFAKYLGYSFDTSLMVDGMSFGEKLMNRIPDNAEIKAIHTSIVRRFSPMVVMIDLSTQAQVSKTSTVADIIYYETLKSLELTVSTDPKIIEFNALLKLENKYDEFVTLVRERKGKDWKEVQKNGMIANLYASELAPVILPSYFQTKEDFKSLSVESVENEEERILRLINLIQTIKGKDKVLFVLDEAGQYVSSNSNLILNLQGFMQTIKSHFKGNVWVIATAQQTLTEDNPTAQLNSNQLFKLNDRFPIKVDIEAEDIKEIITKRLLGKSKEGKEILEPIFTSNEGSIKLNTKLTGLKERSRYLQPISASRFVDFYPFLPVHIDILLALLQKLASRTGGVGLRSVIRLIRDILVDKKLVSNKLADETVGILANPSYFYDVLRPDMEKSSDYKEIVIAANQAIRAFNDNSLAVIICKTIAVMQILDDFPLTYDNICALLYSEVGKDVNKTKVRELLNEIKDAPGITLEEVEGEFRFMTNAILSVKEERSNMTVSDQKRDEVLKSLVKNLLSPTPQVQIFGSKTIKPGVELSIGRRAQTIESGDHLKIDFHFVEPSDFESVEGRLRAESTDHSNERMMYMVSTLPVSIDAMLNEIVRSEAIVQAHSNDTNKEVKDYLTSQEESAREKKREINRILGQALDNSEAIYRGQTMAVDSTTYVSKALRGFAEKTFEKYSYAPKSVNTTAIKDLAKYENWATLPESLNPFGIVKSDGSIDMTADALRELNEYIAAKDPDGSRLLSDFEAAPFGWAKDTTRYLVALLLKDGKIVVRAGAQTFKMLTEKAADVMKTNVLFGHVCLSRNTDRQLTNQEKLTARNRIKELFNPANVALTPDSIAKASYKAVAGGFKELASSLGRDFHDVGMAGDNIVAKAVDYSDRIIASEGADAPVLFSQNDDCFLAMKYVLDVNKSGVIPTVKSIRKRLKEIDTLTQLPQLRDFFNEYNSLKETFNTLLQDAECFNHSSEYADIDTKLKNAIKTACVDFSRKQTAEIKQIIQTTVNCMDTSSLTEEQLSIVYEKINAIQISGGSSITDLREAINQYNLAFNPSGSIQRIKQTVEDFIEENRDKSNDYDPSTTPASTANDSGGETVPDPHSQPSASTPARNTVVRTASRMKRTEVLALIQNLQSAASSMNDADTIELNLI